MAPGSVNLGNHLNQLCNSFPENKGYLRAYEEFLRNEHMIIFENQHVCLYVPYGQISIHELQIMLKRRGTGDYLSLEEDEVVSLSIAEIMAVKLLDELGIHSFNEIIITLPFDSDNSAFSLIMCFVTREVDLAVSELNHLFVVDKYPEDTRELLDPIKNKVIQNIKEQADGLWPEKVHFLF